MQYHRLRYEHDFDFEAGGRLPGLDVVYHTSPRPYRPGERVVWICHALTANSDASEWWPQMVGPGLTFDTDRYYVVCVNFPGSPYGTSGPASTDPDTGRPYFFTFPRVTVRDMAAVNTIVREHLGIETVDLLVGASIGGFVALEWAISQGERIRRAVFMTTAARVSPYLSAYQESQRMALEADPTFRRAESLDGGRAGLRCARSIALISYRSHDGYVVRQQEPDPDCLFAGRSASYQRHQGDKFVDRFDAYSYLYVTDAVDSHNVGRGRGGVEAALASVRAETVAVGIDSDCIFPPQEVQAMAAGIPGGRYVEMTSLFGHDGFLLEKEQEDVIFRQILERMEADSAASSQTGD